METDLLSLKESNAFLNLLLDNINSAILIVDEKMQIHQFNRSFLNLFDNATDMLFAPSFGRISGCVNAVKENASCGETSQCQFCVLKQSLIKTLLADCPTDRRRLDRVFYIDRKPMMKHLEFSSRKIRFQGRSMALVIIYDVTEIEHQRKALEEKQRQIDLDLEAAGAIQKALLPEPDARFRHLDVAWHFEPWRQVGGDLFRIEAIDDGHVALYALDVCGHGVSAAFVAVTVSQFLSGLHNRMRLTRKRFSPAAVLDRLNAAFPMDRFDCFFSIVYASLDTRTGRLTYGNAGHMPPVVLRGDGRLEVLGHHGPVIGVGVDTAFAQAEAALRRGDRLLLYTDGVVENFGPDAERHGKQRFYETLKSLNRTTAGDLVDRVFKRCRTLRGAEPPTDDMSLMAVVYRPE